MEESFDEIEVWEVGILNKKCIYLIIIIIKIMLSSIYITILKFIKQKKL